MNQTVGSIITFAFGGLFGAGMQFLKEDQNFWIGVVLVSTAVVLGVAFAVVGIVIQRREDREAFRREVEKEKYQVALQLEEYSRLVKATFSQPIQQQIGEKNLHGDALDTLTERMRIEIEHQRENGKVRYEIYRELIETLKDMIRDWQIYAITREQDPA